MLCNSVSEESHWKAWPGFVSGSEAQSTSQVRKLSHIAEILGFPDKRSWSCGSNGALILSMQ